MVDSLFYFRSPGYICTRLKIGQTTCFRNLYFYILQVTSSVSSRYKSPLRSYRTLCDSDTYSSAPIFLIAGLRPAWDIDETQQNRNLRHWSSETSQNN